MTQRDLERELVIALAVLGLDEAAIGNRAAITSAYRRLAQTVHPDLCEGPEAARLMDLGTRARDLLLSVELRRRQPPTPTVRVQWTWDGSSSASPW